MQLGSLTLFFDPGERQAAELIAGACARSLAVIRQSWGLGLPSDCHIHVMTSWLRFMFLAAPWPWRVWLALALPLLAGRARSLWPVAGGLHLAYGRRRAIGVKPPWLMAQAETTIGERLFIPAERDDPERKVRHVTCHELAHACTAHLRLPVWLNEGLAMRTVDRFAGEQTVRSDTLQLLARGASRPEAVRDRRWRAGDRDALLYHAARGYWLTRYLAALHPDQIKQLLAQRRSRRAVQRLVAQAIGLDPTDFWQEIDRVLVAHGSWPDGDGESVAGGCEVC